MTSLHKACERGDLDFVRDFLSRPGADVNARDEQEGLTPLLAATEHLPIVQFLCGQGADTMATDDFNRTVLHIATYGGHMLVIEWLFEGRTPHRDDDDDDVGGDDSSNNKLPATRGNIWAECVDKANETALHYAAYRGNLQLTKYLVEVGQMDILARNRLNKTALHLARQAEELPLVSYLQSLVELWNACLAKDCNKMKRLLQAGVFTKFRLTMDGYHLTLTICHLGDVEGARIFHEYDNEVDWNMPSRSGMTPLHCAALNGHEQLVRWLCERGAIVNPPRSMERFPLLSSIDSGNVDIAKVLFEFGADANNRGGSRWSPIFWACRVGCTPMVHLLLDNGARMERENSGWLPLHAACIDGHLDAIQVVLARNGEKPLDPSDWILAVQLASNAGHFHILRFFLLPRIVAMVGKE